MNGPSAGSRSDCSIEVCLARCSNETATSVIGTKRTSKALPMNVCFCSLTRLHFTKLVIADASGGEQQKAATGLRPVTAFGLDRTLNVTLARC